MDSVDKLFLVLHHFIPLLERDALVSIYVQSSNHSDDFCLTGSETVHTTEIHDIVVVENAFAPIVNRLKGLHV